MLWEQYEEKFNPLFSLPYFINTRNAALVTVATNYSENQQSIELLLLKLYISHHIDLSWENFKIAVTIFQLTVNPWSEPRFTSTKTSILQKKNLHDLLHNCSTMIADFR